MCNSVGMAVVLGLGGPNTSKVPLLQDLPLIAVTTGIHTT